MAIRVSGKNIDLGDVLRAQAEYRLNDAVRKYVDAGYSGHVTVAKDGIGFKTECAVHFDHGPVMHVTGEATDAYQSVGIVQRVANSWELEYGVLQRLDPLNNGKSSLGFQLRARLFKF